MIVAYVTSDNAVVSACHVGHLPDGRAKWQVQVEVGSASWGMDDLVASPRWSTEQVIRHTLEWAYSLPDAAPCSCPDVDCPGKEAITAKELFGPTDPKDVELTGPYFDRHEARVAAAVQAGALDGYEKREPTIEELIADLDGKPRPKQEPPEDHGPTWKLT